MTPEIPELLSDHVTQVHACRRCRRMASTPVPGADVVSKVMLVGQAPGEHEPEAGRPFAWRAGRTLFGWFEEHCGVDEETIRRSITFAAVCRCFPGRTKGGSDRTPSRKEAAACRPWLDAEFELLQPELVLLVGGLAIRQLLPDATGKLEDIVGRRFVLEHPGGTAQAIPLPHPSGASPWHKIEPGKTLLTQALAFVAEHPAFRAAIGR
jgi:uracil-DNA glycosylase